MIWILLALGVMVAYRYSLKRHPLRKCPRGCKSGDHVDTTVFRGAFGNCLFCHGKGKLPRWGVRLFMPGTAREIRAGKHGKYF